MNNITLLRPTWDKASTSKTFKLVNKKPHKISDYKLGKTFTYASLRVDSIKALHKVLDKIKDQPLFRIYGHPVDGLPKEASRKKENFECKETDLLMIDADGWEVPEGFNINNIPALHKTIREITINLMGLKFLHNVQFCCMLSSSAWSRTKIRAHIYYLIDNPVTLEFLNSWPKMHNEEHTDYRLDITTFRQVQPDYTSKRCCLGFKDPLLDTLRLSVYCDDNTLPKVYKAGLVEHLTALKNRVNNSHPLPTGGQIYDAVTNTLVGGSNPVTPYDKRTWESALELTGLAGHGINEPAYIASAKLVKSEGPSSCKHNLEFFVGKLHSQLWKQYDSNKSKGLVPSDRDEKADREGYDRVKIKGYIVTAIEKSFGGEIDEKIKPITDAMAAVKAGRIGIGELFDDTVLNNLAFLKRYHNKQYIDIYSKIRTEFKGSINLQELKSGVKSADDTDINILQVCNDITEEYEWIESISDGSLYGKMNELGSYELRSLEDMRGVLQVNAYDKFMGKTPNGFVDNLLARVVVHKDNEYTSSFKRQEVGVRCSYSSKGGKFVVHYNLGKTEAGMYTAKITSDGVHIMPSVQSPILWVKTDSLASMSYKDITSDIIDDPDVWSEFYIGEYLDYMTKFSVLESRSALADLVAWQVSVIVGANSSKILQILGASGSGKSTTARLAKELVDPSHDDITQAVELQTTFPKGQGDLSKLFRCKEVNIFDNLTKLTTEQQNQLCTVATGCTMTYRPLYVENTVSVKIKKPLILTGLSNICTREDLRDRTITVNVLPSTKTKSSTILDDFEAAAPVMRAGLFWLASKVIKELELGYEKNKSSHGGRDSVILEAKKAVYTRLGLVANDLSSDQVEEVINKEQNMERNSLALDSKEVCNVVAWLSEMEQVSTLGRGRSISLSKNEAMNMFETFIIEHIKEDVHVLGIGKITVNATSLNSKVNFGRFLSKSVRDIERVLGITIINARGGKGVRHWQITRVRGT